MPPARLVYAQQAAEVRDTIVDGQVLLRHGKLTRMVTGKANRKGAAGLTASISKCSAKHICYTYWRYFN
jgi:hypothetical protein